MEVTVAACLAAETDRAEAMAPFEKFDALWTALLRAANHLPQSSERERLIALVQVLTEPAVRGILNSEAIRTLVSLDPPLETVATSPHEELYPDRTAATFARIRAGQAIAPLQALAALGEILKRIRNKRAHGFKSSDPGTRDGLILTAASSILREINLSLVASAA
jgi:hypothetical protein